MSLKTNYQWRLENTLAFDEMLLPLDHIGLCAQTQKNILHKNPHSKEMGVMMLVVFTIHTSIVDLQWGYFDPWLLKLI
jgi:hypothetical protein